MERIDILLTLKGHFNSRSRAKQAIIDNKVYVNDKLVTKPSLLVDTDSNIVVKFDALEYVSRGGKKLEKAIKTFNLDFTDKCILDVGASTGGFTDCALKHNASKVIAVDVGSDQLHPSLKEDKRVEFYENTNILSFEIKDNIDYAVMDVSFTSIKPIIDYLSDKVNNIIVLVKPQFELGKVYIKNGVVKDRKLHVKVLKDITSYISNTSLSINDFTYSPIKGGSGNIEFILHMSNTKSNKIFDVVSLVEDAHTNLKKEG